MHIYIYIFFMFSKIYPKTKDVRNYSLNCESNKTTINLLETFRNMCMALQSFIMSIFVFRFMC